VPGGSVVLVEGSTVVEVDVEVGVVPMLVDVVEADGAHAASKTTTQRRRLAFTNERLPAEGR
jgi:hypothetical protein